MARQCSSLRSKLVAPPLISLLLIDQARLVLTKESAQVSENKQGLHEIMLYIFVTVERKHGPKLKLT
eukprot:scaffold3016_cov114-Skeletonema_dohrnii-CCMP3373.AAC.5